MNNKVFLALSILQTVIGFLVVLSFVVLAVGGEEVRQYIATFVVGIVFLIMGIIGIVNFFRKK